MTIVHQDNDTDQKKGFWYRTLDALTGYPVWARVIAERDKRNRSDAYPKRRVDMYATSDRIYIDTDKVMYMYTIDGYSRTVPVQWRHDLMCKIEDAPDMNINFEEVMVRDEYDYSTSKNKSWLSHVKRQEGKVSAADRDKTLTPEEEEEISKTERRGETMKYILYTKKNGHRLLAPKLAVKVFGKRGHDFDRHISEIEEYFENNGIQANRVTEDIQEYYGFFSPFSTDSNSTQAFYKKLGHQMMSDEQVANLSFDTGGGIIGSGDFLLGADVFTGNMVLTTMKKDSQEPENTCIMATTGGGKSFKFKSHLIQFLARDNYVATIADIEGDEYLQLATYLGQTGVSTTIIKMGLGGEDNDNVRYYDPCEIHSFVADVDGEGDEKGISGYTNSYDSALKIIQTLCFGTSKLNEVQRILTEEIVGQTYQRRGVNPSDKSTWGRSAGMRLHDMYDTAVWLRNMAKSGDRNTLDESSNHIIDAIREFKAYAQNLATITVSLSRYFTPAGSRAHIFKNRITLDEFIDAKLVINSFGLRFQAQGTVDPVLMGLAQLYSSQITYLRTHYAFSRGKYSVNMFEEFQRSIEIDGLYEHLKQILSGSRKNGGVNYVATNEPLKLCIEKPDFFENMQSFIVGGIASDAVKVVAEKIRASAYVDILKKIAEENKDNEEEQKQAHYNPLQGREIADYRNIYDNPYKHAFFIFRKNGSQVAVTRAPAPPEIIDNDLFYTGVRKVDDNDRVVTS